MSWREQGAAPRSLGVERGRDGAGGDFAGAIGHAMGHLKDVGKAGARDRAGLAARMCRKQNEACAAAVR